MSNIVNLFELGTWLPAQINVVLLCRVHNGNSWLVRRINRYTGLPTGATFEVPVCEVRKIEPWEKLCLAC